MFPKCVYGCNYISFPKIGGKPPKWMVKIMENPIKMDDLGGTMIFGNTHISFPLFAYLFTQLMRPNFHLHMRQLRHLRMHTSLTHASDSATSLAHAPTFPSRFAHARFGVSGWGFGVGS